jgi:hypothetical protein
MTESDYTTTTLWQKTLGVRAKDRQAEPRARLHESFLRFRERAKWLVSLIPRTCRLEDRLVHLMPAYFFDSSALVKRFAREQGSAFVLSLLRPSTKNRLYAARITEVEVCAALSRRKKGNTINAAQAANGLRRLRRDLPEGLLKSR